MGGTGGSHWGAARSFSRDRSVGSQSLTPGTTRRILGYAQPYRAKIAVFLVVTVVSAAATAAVPLLLKVVIDDGVVPGARDVVIWGALAVAGLAFADAALSLVGRWMSARIGEGLIYDLRREVFDHVQRQPIAFFTRAQTGSLVSRLNTDVVGAQAAFTGTLSQVVSNAVTLVVVLVAMIALSWQITAAVLVLVPLFLLPARWFGKRLAALSRQGMELNAELSQTMTERFNVSGALLVKIFGRYHDENAAFSNTAASVRDIGVKQAMFARYFFVGLTLLTSLATAGVYGIGGWMAIDGTLQVGSLVALAALLTRLYGPLTALSNVQVDIMTALVSFDRVFEIVDLQPMVRDAEDAQPLPAHHEPLAIEFDHVGFRYPEADEVSLDSLESVMATERHTGDVLHDVTFSVQPGETVALVGPSGAGKSTITHLVSRLYDPTSGTVRLGGQDLREVTLASVHDVTGVVSQEAHLFHDTIRANLQLARPEASDDDLWAALRAAQIAALVESLPDGLDTLVGDRGHRLSGGEKQRLAIARLLLKEPDVVVLDEATAHLDSESEVAVQEALRIALEGRTSLVIAHRLSTVRDADRIVVVVDGRIDDIGTHDDLLSRDGAYADLYRTQFAQQETSGAVPV